ncbi:MAG: hybrid sensor histidine kinase/response regulator [Planctomycetes bacterium]|nr:hybrid sensor histidine kinase/response regulator [Planctomycetota bacterium]
MEADARILAVDDDPINASIIEEIFGGHCKLEVASSGEQAISSARGFRPDVVLLDIMMPGIDGYEVCRRIRADAALRHTKIILVSAKALVAERLRGYEAGADDYVTKPFDEDELKAKVEVYLRLKRVEEVDQLKTETLELVSHEVHTPLTGIIPVAELLLADQEMSAEERRQFLESIARNAKALHRLFTKAMLLLNLKTGRTELEKEPLDLRPLLSEAVEGARALDLERGVEVDLEAAGALPVRGDASHLKLALDAVLENAVRFSPASGTVKLTALGKGKTIEISVADSGPGIDAAVMPRIFDGFSVSDVRHHTKGTGLSLALCRCILRAHGGDIAASSPPGGGATVTITLPAGEAAPPAPGSVACGAGPDARRA